MFLLVSRGKNDVSRRKKEKKKNLGYLREVKIVNWVDYLLSSSVKNDRKLRNVLGRKHVGNIGADISEGKIRKKYNSGKMANCK